MSISYDVFTGAFLNKISEYDLIDIPEKDRDEIVDGYMKAAIASFKKICKYDLTSTRNDESREFSVDISSDDLDEIVDIVTEGMVVHWLKPYVYNQDLLQSVLNTKDYTTYSTERLLLRVKETYRQAKKDYIQDIREYSYNYGRLSELHL